MYNFLDSWNTFQLKAVLSLILLGTKNFKILFSKVLRNIHGLFLRFIRWMRIISLSSMHRIVIGGAHDKKLILKTKGLYQK